MENGVRIIIENANCPIMVDTTIIPLLAKTADDSW